MPSPFPGMNPYLEQPDCWQDFHRRFVVRLADMLAAQLPANYVTRLGAHTYLHELTAEERKLSGRAVETFKSSYLTIRETETGRLITRLELLTLSNKSPGPHRETFLAERRNLLGLEVNYVELDLLRGGPRSSGPRLPTCDYCILQRRALDLKRMLFWPIQLRDRLPVIPVPLRPPDADVPLDLQQALHLVYDAAHYQNYIYSGEPQPPLSLEDAAWARDLAARH